jgi:quinoprotein glucose dehydrogenase
VFGEDTIKSVVKYGLQDMPAYPDLNETLLKSLVLYLDKPASAPEPIVEQESAAAANGTTGKAPVRYWSGYGLQPSIVKPPWSTLTAYNLREGKINWQVPLGDAPPVASQGVNGTGVMMPRNGPVVTAGGLIFVATKYEGKFRAYDEDTGKEVWSFSMPAASEGVPAVYEVDGQEYIVVCATSGKETGIPTDGPSQPTAEPVKRAYLAFALPKNLAFKQ